MGITTLELLKTKYELRAKYAYRSGDYFIHEQYKLAADLLDETIHAVREAARLTMEKTQATAP